MSPPPIDENGRPVLDAPAGGAKTTTLLQLADRHSSGGLFRFLSSCRNAWMAIRLFLILFQRHRHFVHSRSVHENWPCLKKRFISPYSSTGGTKSAATNFARSNEVQATGPRLFGREHYPCYPGSPAF